MRRFFTTAGITAVTVVAGAISYRHQQHLAFAHGQPHALAVIWPLCVDGLVASTGIAVAADRAAGFRPRLWALVGFWLGVVVSVATNWLATDGGIIAHGVSAFPALAFLLSVESLSAKPRAAKRAVMAAARVVEPAAAVTPPDAPPARVVDATPPAIDRPAAPSRKVPPAVRKTATTAERMARALTVNPAATVADLARAAKVSESTARRHLRTLAAPSMTVIDAESAQLDPNTSTAVNGHSATMPTGVQLATVTA